MPIALTTLVTSNPSVSILCRPVSIDARDDLHAAGQARCRRDREGDSIRRHVCLPRHPRRHVVGRQRASLEHEHAA